MSSMFGHAVAGLTLSAAFTRGRPPRRVWGVAVACALAPDLDWFTGVLPLGEGHSLAHRGLSHSLVAAALITALAMLIAFRDRLRSPRLWLCMAAATLSHGLLDAWTFGGTGVAFLAPFSDVRFVAQWQPLFVSPIPLSGRLLEWLMLSLVTELAWVGLPGLVVFLLARRSGRRRAPAGAQASSARSMRLSGTTQSTATAT